MARFIVALLLAVALVWATAGAWFDSFTEEEVAPVQPVPFRHDIHAGQLQLACEYCHRYAWSAEEATIPSIRLCMGCHEYNGVETEGTAVLFSFWEQNIEPPWVRVYEIPPLNRFSHKRHLAAGVPCEHCHGDVRTMARLSRAVEWQMGLCVDCHHQNDASVDCYTCYL